MTYTNTALEYCIRSFALIRFYRSLFLAADIAVEPEVRGASMTLANSEFPLTNDFSGHKIFMKIVHYPV